MVLKTGFWEETFKSRSVSYISAAGGTVEGLQYTYDFDTKWNRSAFEHKHDPNGYLSLGSGINEEWF